LAETSFFIFSQRVKTCEIPRAYAKYHVPLITNIEKALRGAVGGGGGKGGNDCLLQKVFIICWVITVVGFCSGTNLSALV
jgi:hypothetical protein